MKKLLVALSLPLLALSGCMTIDPLTGEQKMTATSKNAATGAAIGGILGMALSKEDRKKGAIIGAGIGALSGAAVGSYMDRQEQELRDSLEGTGVTVSRVGDDLILNMPSNVTFATNESGLRDQFVRTLEGVVVVLEEYDSTLITIEGHTDSTGAASYNQTLSEQRAMSVATFLNQQGVQLERIAAFGQGEAEPLASNETPEGRAANRRVELRLEPLTLD